jgi:hypothetical protein
MFNRFARLWRRATALARDEPDAATIAPLPSLESDLAAAGLSAHAWCDAQRGRRACYSSIPSAAIDALRRRDADRVRQTIRAADRVLRHEFDLLGSGPYCPVDPDRPARSGYVPIDWYLDPVRSLRFPRGVPHKKWNLMEMRPGNADVKYPWELARCQHWATLGQAYQFTTDDRFAREIADELDDFVDANPTGIGINWTCTMDVGLRAVSWAIGLELVRESPVLDQAFWMRAYTALFDHGVFIRNNLENTYEVTSNHFLSDLLGLLFLARVFADLPQGAEWNTFSCAAIEHEMDVQVLPDGADYESSIPYHRLVAELFLGAARLTDHHREPLSKTFRSRVRDMIAYLAAVTRPDGLMPQAGDADDGRLHVLEGYATTPPQDARHLFGPAAVIFDEPAWRVLGGDAGAWEAAWWGLGSAPGREVRRSTTGDTEDTEAKPKIPSASSVSSVVESSTNPPSIARLFPQAGVAVARTTAGHYLLVTNGIVGTNGFGNHKHNDLLSFEYHHRGTPLVVDPGSYVYTSDADARNRFRGTAYHNTVMVDRTEQNDLRPDWLFRLFETSKAETISFDNRGDVVEYSGRHHGYEHLSDPITHERTFTFQRESGALVIVDRLSGRGRHDLRWHFHVAPGVTAQCASETSVVLAAAGRQWMLTLPAGLSIAIQPAAYSPSYGVSMPCLAIDAAAEADVEGERHWRFELSPVA